MRYKAKSISALQLAVGGWLITGRYIELANPSLWIDSGAAYPGTYTALGTGTIGSYEENQPTTTDWKWPETQLAAEVLPGFPDGAWWAARLLGAAEALREKMGLHKALPYPERFVKLVLQYDMVSSPLLLNSIGAALPWFEVFCGLLLVLGVGIRGAALNSVVMLVPFTLIVLSLFFGCLFTHEQRIACLTVTEWEKVLADVDRATARWERIFKSYDAIAAYAKSRYDSRLIGADFDAKSGRMRLRMTGKATVPLSVYVFAKGDLTHRYQEIPAFQGERIAEAAP